MKLLAVGDLHIRPDTPENRIDDFVETQMGKVAWVLEVGRREKCVAMFLPGDLTDHPRIPYHLINRYVALFLGSSMLKFGVYGQHDLRYHTSHYNTPVQNLRSANAIYLLNPHRHMVIPSPDETLYHVYGCDYGVEPEEPVHLGPKFFNILVIHKMFVHEKIWPGQEDYTRANIFLRKSSWDLIVSGDNHQSFTSDSCGRWLINCGSLMRTRIDQKDHVPCIYIIDTVTREAKRIVVPHKPFLEVMDIERAQEKKEKDLRIQAFLDQVKDRKEVEISGLDFEKNLNERMQEEDIDNDTREMMQEVMEDAWERCGRSHQKLTGT